uniref:Uncharacterized protein n=1 Tax=Anguilla anguilla TaxID=7936 RepID=A0A0E9VEC2_ANGAN
MLLSTSVNRVIFWARRVMVHCRRHVLESSSTSVKLANVM